MENRLELKDICGYLPYGLKVINYCGDIDDAVSLIDNMALTGFAENSTPILRPMSDLTNEITHNAETFVPVVELAKILFPYTDVKKFNGYNVFVTNKITKLDYLFTYDIITNTFSTSSELLSHNYNVYDKLSEWLFDYRKLIDKGLAIDVNTLNEKVYG